MQPLAPSDPRQAGEFRLSARLGYGGMGQVFLGYSPAGRAVAVKVCHPELAADPAFVERFAREVTAAQSVNGLYTAQVVGAGPYDRPPWLATAYVPGPSLTDYVHGYGPLPEPAAWRLAAGIAEALLAVHARGLVHRDLKPSNVLLAVDGPRVIDFGIARALEASGLTDTGSVMGSPPYMSPEQAMGKPTGPASDVFALGSTVAFAACGAPPFGDGDAPALLFRVVHLEAALDAVPERLRAVVAACLAKDPAVRPTLPQLLRACQDSAAAGGNSAASFWPAPMTAALAQYQANLASITPSTGTSLATGTSLGGGTVPPPAQGLSGGQQDQQQGQSGSQGSYYPLTVATSSGGPVQLSPAGRVTAAIGRRRMLTGIGGVVVAGGLGVVGWKLASLTSPAAAGTNTGGNSADRLAWKFTADGPVRTGVVVSVDGETVYVGTDTGTVYALNAASGRQVATFKVDGPVSGVAVAGATLLVGGADGSVHAFATASAGGDLSVSWTSPRIGTTIAGAPVGPPKSGGSSAVYAASADGYVASLNVKTGRQNWRTRIGKGAVVGNQPGTGPSEKGSALGTTVVWAGNQDGTMHLIDVKSGRTTHTYAASGAISAGPWVHYGNAYFGTSKGLLYDVDADPIGGSSMSVPWTFQAKGAIVGAPVASGDNFFTTTANGQVSLVEPGNSLDNSPGTALWTCPVGPVQAGPTFADNTLYIGSTNANLYAIDTSQGTVSWQSKPGGPITSQVAAENGLVYFGTLDHQVYAVRGLFSPGE